MDFSNDDAEEAGCYFERSWAGSSSDESMFDKTCLLKSVGTNAQGDYHDYFSILNCTQY